MDYKLINEALKSVENLRHGNSKFKKVSSSKIDNLRGRESQVEYNEIIEVYSLEQEDLHLKLVLRTDSYGDNEFVHSVQIVKPIVKQVTDFEPVN
jgi:hypothetical protein